MKLLIAEDEFLCRENLKNIDWESIGVSLCGVAENGQRRWNSLKDSNPILLFPI